MLVCVLHWAKSAPNKGRILVVLALIAVLGIASYGYLRRQWLKYLRHQAVDAASGLTTNLQAFEVSTTAVLSLVQEVELVSKGYRMCVMHYEVCNITSKTDRRQELSLTTYLQA